VLLESKGLRPVVPLLSLPWSLPFMLVPLLSLPSRKPI
jgi:hypothetical protein